LQKHRSERLAALHESTALSEAPKLLIAGGGIGGLAAALAGTRAGWGVQLFERAAVFSEVGAGIQLGPNVVRVLQEWGLAPALRSVAAFPPQLQVRDAHGGQVLGRLQLADMPARHGAAYATIHRADLHGLLLAAVRAQGTVQLHQDTTVSAFDATADGVRLATLQVGGADGPAVEGTALIGADGLWSRVREALLHDGPPRLSGHLAYRALVPQASLPAALRSQDVTAWLGPRLHVIGYPVCAGAALNVVAFVHGSPPGADASPGALAHWDHSANAADLRAALAGCATPLRDLVQAIDHWRLWVMSDRPPMTGPHQQAQGRIALLGDAAHPMRPYLAQGAGMAIEDAQALGGVLQQAGTDGDIVAALARYAQQRWRRNARVQARAERNGRIFHATGPVRWGRNLAMRLLGERLLDMPWLYGQGRR
jgi:salicylate hydroxylase